MSLQIQSDDVALEAIKPANRHRYKKIWKNYKEFSTNNEDLEQEIPKEENILRFIRHLRTENGKLSIICLVISIILMIRHGIHNYVDQLLSA